MHTCTRMPSHKSPPDHFKHFQITNILDRLFLLIFTITTLLIKSHVRELKAWLAHKLAVNAENAVELSGSQEGCLGPAIKVLDVQEGSHTVNISNDKLTVQSQTAFSTVKANCCVYKGRWMYEVRPEH